MLAILARNWWVFLLRGVAGVIFGILAIVWPLLTLQVLILPFGAYALVDGVFTVIAGSPRTSTISAGGYCFYTVWQA